MAGALAVVAVAAGVLALVAAPGWMRRPDSGAGAAAPLRDDRLQLRVWSPDGRKRGWVIGTDPGALPGRPGDELRAEVRLNEPAHVYLLALDAQGEVLPLYPWHRNPTRLEKTLDDPPPVVPPQAELTWPSPESGRGLALDDRSGLETIVLLARRTPLPADVSLAEVVGRQRLGATPLRHPEEFALRGGDPGEPTDAINVGQNRGFQKDLPRIDDPLEQLLGKLRPHFELLRAVRFAHQGK
jgi:hypothetical protein